MADRKTSLAWLKSRQPTRCHSFPPPSRQKVQLSTDRSLSAMPQLYLNRPATGGNTPISLPDNRIPACIHIETQTEEASHPIREERSTMTSPLYIRCANKCVEVRGQDLVLPPATYPTYCTHSTMTSPAGTKPQIPLLTSHSQMEIKAAGIQEKDTYKRTALYWQVLHNYEDVNTMVSPRGEVREIHMNPHKSHLIQLHHLNKQESTVHPVHFSQPTAYSYSRYFGS